jgi:hypothetical protein
VKQGMPAAGECSRGCWRRASAAGDAAGGAWSRGTRRRRGTEQGPAAARRARSSGVQSTVRRGAEQWEVRGSPISLGTLAVPPPASRPTEQAVAMAHTCRLRPPRTPHSLGTDTTKAALRTCHVRHDILRRRSVALGGARREDDLEPQGGKGGAPGHRKLALITMESREREGVAWSDGRDHGGARPEAGKTTLARSICGAAAQFLCRR